MVNAYSKDQARAFWGPLVDTRLSGVPVQSSASNGSDSLDSELAVLDEMVIRARKLRNSRLGPGRLPSEIIVSVFLLVREIWPPSRSLEGGGVRFHSGWFTVTHVSSLWRKIALEAPVLWTKHDNVINMSLQYLPVILSRSRLNRLEIGIDLYDRAGGQTYKDALKHHGDAIFDRARGWLCQPMILRAETLSVEGCDIALLHKLASLAPHLSNLRNLTLSSWEDASFHELPSSLTRLSQLTELTLLDIYLPWTSPIFSANLTCLELRVPHDEPGEQGHLISFEELRTLFSRMQSLTSLEVTDLIPNGPSEEIHLPPGLRTFTFKTTAYHSPAEFAHSLQLLANIKCPVTCTRYTRLCMTEPAGELSEMERGVVEEGFEAITTFPSCTAREIYLYHTGVTALTTEGSIKVSPSGSSPRPFTAVVVRGQFYSPHLAHLDIGGLSIINYIGSLNIWDVRVATLSGRRAQSIVGSLGPLIKFGIRAPNLRRIGLYLANSSFLLNSLMNMEAERFTLFPKLEAIIFHGVGKAGTDDATFTLELSALVNLVHLRKGEGAPLREIVTSKAAESWGIWDSLKGEVNITFM